MPPKASRAPSVPPTPRAVRVSPKKREAPSELPAVAISSNLAPSSVLSRRLSFGTVDVDAEVVVSPKKAHRPVATRGEAEASPEVEASTPSKRAGFKRRCAARVPHPNSLPLPLPPMRPASTSPFFLLTLPRSTIKASKQSLSSANAARDRRRANPAKRIRPIARRDSVDKVSKTSPIDIPSKGVPALSPPLSDGGEDELWPDTPRPSGVLAMLDLEAEEAVDGDNEDDGGLQDDAVGDWLDDSPPPRRVAQKAPKSSTAGAPAKGGKGNASVDCVRPPVVAAVDGPSADVFAAAHGTGTQDNPIFYMDSDIDDVDEHPVASQAEETLQEVDVINFPSIPPILAGILDYLKSSGRIQNIQFSELRPKYTARDEAPAKMPQIETVLSKMKNEYAMVPIFDSLLFRGLGVYVNPLTADPKLFHVVGQKVVFSSGVNKGNPAVFVMPIVVKECNLLAPVVINEKWGDGVHLKLTGWVFNEVFELFSSFIGSVLNLDSVYAYMTSLSLQFTSLKGKSNSSTDARTPRTPGKTAQDALSFAEPHRTPRRTTARTPVDVRYPHVYGPYDKIPVYNGRSRYGDFRLEEKQWASLSSMPLYGAPVSVPGRAHDNSRPAEITPATAEQYKVALVAFTMGTFKPSDNLNATQVSFNLIFSILLGTCLEHRSPRNIVTLEKINSLRASAAAAAQAQAFS
ncbi:hypothetical protein PC9H_008904 [Pleurotus ostreatus]|uniref:Uncharacterized protein n=1 Tax=Pleurotus ostreatus TaxID=5322 RepID=A0A8H6ZWP9_PLEOS|nr:uncharacterized protein PC9H_008904 [Pleurotus ostreatus]KAF7426535.1 hypothetical protein PC9H_008904 [Pleurotus ostreatus]